MAVSQKQLESAPSSIEPTVQEVYESALEDHKDFLDFVPETDLKDAIGSALSEIALYETVARQPLSISTETAANIGTIWVHSGTGSYDERFKPEDNPRLTGKPWIGGFDHARLSHAALLARKVAEARSGQAPLSGSLATLAERKEATKELIAKYGPDIFYSGYAAETRNLEALLKREDIIIPAEKVSILHKDLKVTADAIRTFEYRDDEAQRKEVAIVTHGAHMARVLHMANHYQPFVEGAMPYIAPVATPEAGRKEFALMEARGLMYYMFMTHDAAEQPHAFQLLHQSEAAR